MNRKVTENEQQWQMEKGISERVTVCLCVAYDERKSYQMQYVCVWGFCYAV